MTSHKNRNGVPDRWLDYKNVGKRIPGTRFVSFKVPLKQALNRNLSQSEVFGPWELLDALQKQKEELGLIIDLTFTTRYYKLEDIPDSMLCLKIFTAGHAVPGDETILSFKQAVHGFLQDNKDNVFNSSRGHAIERENYLRDLQFGPKRRSHTRWGPAHPRDHTHTRPDDHAHYHGHAHNQSSWRQPFYVAEQNGRHRPVQLQHEHLWDQQHQNHHHQQQQHHNGRSGQDQRHHDHHQEFYFDEAAASDGRTTVYRWRDGYR
ncbi:hypothetical protein CRUP_027281 [Coryphaenoides rupestris]|nr:hypothetical protein CRUP_027281 [Coryphaenoides rupestris]